jgi:hypothetical protein
MKRRDFLILISVAVITGVFSLILASVVFAPKKLSQKVPVVDKITDSFPDVRHDPSYTSFLNNNSLDLTQPVQIGPHNQNQKPFSQSP